MTPENTNNSNGVIGIHDDVVPEKTPATAGKSNVPASLKKQLFRCYQSPLGKMMYSTRFCRWDWLGIFLIFAVTTFFAMLSGQKATESGYIGDWYAFYVAPVALSIYNTGELGYSGYEPGSALDNFMNRGSHGEREFFSITNEEAKAPSYAKDYYSEIGSTAIPYLVALWWKMVGYPDWSTIYILFAILYGLTIVSGYFALRQVAGLSPSVFMAVLAGAERCMMLQFIFWFRDGARAGLCFIAIAILLYLLKRGLNWKGTVVCSFFLFVICSLFYMFRNDFIVFIPFIAIAVIFFHGEFFDGFSKKALIVSSIVLGLITATAILPREKTVCGFGHVLYVGLADRPFMDDLRFSSGNYSKAIPFSDFFGFMIASSKAYRDRGVVNLPSFSEEYDKEIKKELYSLIEIYPFDFLRLAWSSCIQSMRTGYLYSERILEHIGASPGYWMFQEKSRGFYSRIPCWLYAVFFTMTLLLMLGGRFYANIVLCLAIMCMSGCYLLQFDIRHFFFLMIVPLLSCGFVINRSVRLVSLCMENKERMWKRFLRKKKVFLTHCAVAAGLVILGICAMQASKLIQEKHIRREIAGFDAAKMEEVNFQSEQTPSLINALPAASVNLPGFCQSVLERENPQQIDFTEFLKVKFKVIGEYRKEQVYVFAKYENTQEMNLKFPLFYLAHFICNYTKTCPNPYCFYARQGTNTLYFPVYFSRGYSPLTGLEFVAGGKTIEIESVERVAETENIHSQSAFLIPESPEDMRYLGRVRWKDVFWGKM